MNSKSQKFENLKVGLFLTRIIEVGTDRVITFMGDDLRVYETPSMIADIEYACRDLLFDHLPSGFDSVGTIVDIQHLAATPLGQTVCIKVEIEQIQSRLVQFNCKVNDALDLVGSGSHTRAIVSVDRHRIRVSEKLSKLKNNES